jgi:hypothetical protein
MPLHLHPDVVTTDTDDGMVLLHQRTGRYWQLNTTGASVLRRLLDGHTPEEIARGIAGRHGVAINRVQHDIAQTIEQLHTTCLLETRR